MNTSGLEANQKFAVRYLGESTRSQCVKKKANMKPRRRIKSG